MRIPERRLWHVVLGFQLASISAACGSEMRGVVKDPQGEPLPGATVFIHTAGPRFGTAIYCPSCYDDCQKQTTTNDDGGFVIESLDPSLVFRILVAAEGRRPKLVGSIDPAKDEPVVYLDPLPAHLEPSLVLRGRVVDGQGKPVVGAEVQPYARYTGGTTTYGSFNEIDPVSVTNQDGQFLLVTTEQAEAYAVEVASADHPNKKFARLALGENHELALDAGVTVRGRLLKNERPVAGVVVGLAHCDRSSEVYLGHHEIGTNSDGRFELSYVPAGADYYLYTQMETMAAIGALPLRRVTLGNDGSVEELGNLEVGPAHTLSGRLILDDGLDLPGPVQVLVSREGAWDSQELMVEGDGAFEFYAVPHDEPVSIYARIPGYRLATGKNRFQHLRNGGIGIFVDRPRDDIEIHFEPEQ